MKTKLLLIGLFLSLSLNTFAQFKENSKYANDVVVSNEYFANNRLKMSVAYNGWIYVVFNTLNTTENKGGIHILKSTNGGLSWESLIEFAYENENYPLFDIQVVGNSESDLYLYLAGVNTNVNNVGIFIDKYNAIAGNLISGNSVLISSIGAITINDVDLETDYRSPSANAAPYSIGLAYSYRGLSHDSIDFVVSNNGGQTFLSPKNIYTTTNHIKKISLAYGKSASVSNGGYNIAWDEFTNINDNFGKIYTSGTINNIDGNWISPICLDDISMATQNKCKNPSMASQYGMTDNSSSSFTSVVFVENSENNDINNTGLVMFKNPTAHITNTWSGFSFGAAQSGVKKQPCVAYDSVNQNFLLTYFDSTAQKLPYYYASTNNITSWNIVTSGYNDEGRNLFNPNPRVEINPVNSQVAHAWFADELNISVPLFDAEYSTSIKQILDNKSITIYPNPVKNKIYISLQDVDSNEALHLNMYNSIGQLVYSTEINILHETIDVSHLENGIYQMIISSKSKNVGAKIIINK